MKPQLQSELISNKMDQAKINAEIQKLLDKDNIKIGEEKLKDMYKITNQSKEKPSSK